MPQRSFHARPCIMLLPFCCLLGSKQVLGSDLPFTNLPLTPEQRVTPAISELLMHAHKSMLFHLSRRSFPLCLHPTNSSPSQCPSRMRRAPRGPVSTHATRICSYICLPFWHRVNRQVEPINSDVLLWLWCFKFRFIAKISKSGDFTQKSRF